MSYSNDDLKWTEVRDLFRSWRDDNERKSDEVVQLWENVLEEKFSKLDNEKHLILEQVIMAAFDCNKLNVADKCIFKLTTEFPKSLRVEKYKAMRLEIMNCYDDALEAINIIITHDETNAAPRKRKVAILKAQGKTTEAIKELCEYTKKFMSDQEGWHELCNLFLSEGDYAKAAFCMEELILHNPHNHLYHQRLGEIRYTMGGLDNIESAKTYYSQALKLNPNNIRALYGLYLCCNHIVNSKSTLTKRKDAQKTAQSLLGKIQSLYSNDSEDNEDNSIKITALENAFSSLDIK